MLNVPSQARHDAEHPKWSTPVAAVLGILLLCWFLSTGVNQLVAAALFLSIGGVLVIVRPSAAIVATLVYLAFLGDIRRYISLQAGQVSQDPLLVVAPGVIAVLFARLLFERRVRPDTPLSKLVLALMIIMALEILNPLQGGITVGVAGALYYLVPLLWFWAGRSMPSVGITATLIKFVIPITAGLAALLGLYQTFVGWLPFEAHWIRQQIANGFAAMVINGSVVRAFGFFTSPAEYAGFLAMGMACCVAPLVVGRFRAVALLIPLLAWAMLLESVRSAIVLAALAVLGMWSILGRDGQQIVTRAFLAAVIGGGGLYFAMHRLIAADTAGDRVQTLYAHTAEGLLNPGESSAQGHWEIALTGIGTGLKNPVGWGLGATTMAAQKFGSHGLSGFENDVANLFASLGAFGGLLYVVLILAVLCHVFVVWRDRRSFAALAVFGILISQLGYWLEGGHYSLVAICWFLIGSVDRQSSAAVLAAGPARVPTRIPQRPPGREAAPSLG